MKGVYGIKINNCLVYIGKSEDLEARVSAHWHYILENVKKIKENKYKLLNWYARRKGYKITFWLLDTQVENELLWIQSVQPCLNSQGNHNRGKEITMNEFYNIVLNEEHYIEGATEWPYEKSSWGYKK